MRRPGKNRVFSFLSGAFNECGRLIEQLFVLRAQQPRPHALRLETLEDRSVPSTTTLTEQNSTIYSGQGASLTARVTGVSPTGTVTFMDGSTVIGTESVTNGYASLDTWVPSIGTHTITAVYNGDGNNAASTSNSVTETVNIATPTTNLTTDAPTIYSGQTTDLTAVMTVPGAGPTGRMTFMDGSTVLGTVPFSGDYWNGSSWVLTAYFSDWSPSVGTHTVTAVYNGDANDAASTSNSVTVTVNIAPSTTSLTTSNPTINLGQTTDLTATVTAPVDPTGTVTFMDGSTVIGTIPFSTSGWSYNQTTHTWSMPAVFSDWSPSVGTHTITAVYPGDANTAGSTSNSVTETVNSGTTTTLTSSGTSTYGQSVTFTATVAATSGTATGTVTFMDGTTTLGTASLNGSGVATFSTTALSAGTHTITATYNPTGFFAGSSGSVSQVVNKAALTVTANNQSSVYGSPLPALTYSYSGLVNGDTSSVFSGSLSTTATSTSSVGNYSITQGNLSAGSNYIISFTAGTLTITPAVLTITANNQTMIYNSPVPTLTYAASGFVNGDTAASVLSGALATTATKTSPVGTYAITQGTLAAGPNYTISFTNGTLTVTPLKLKSFSNDTPNPLTCPGTLAQFLTALANLPAATTNAPVRFADGSNQITATDLSSDAFGQAWGVGRSWSNNPQGFAAGSSLGTGWVMTQQPRLFLNQGDLVMVADATTAFDFSHQGTPDANGNYPSYIPEFGGPGSITYDSTDDQFVLTDGVGDVLRFNGFSSSWTTGQQGALASITNAAGVVTAVTSWTAAGWPAEVQQSATVNGVTVINSYVYTYLPSTDPNAGNLASVVLRQKTGTGPWQTVQQVVYQYYDGTTSNGNLGDLERATVEDAAGNVLSEDYYRYYTTTVFTNGVQTGYQGGLEYVLQPDAYARLKAAAGGTDAAVDAASNSTVTTFADNYFQYDSANRVSEEVAAGEGCSACSGGLGTYTFSYTTSTNTAGFNSWATKTVVSMPNGAIETEYTNAYGDVMLSVIEDPTTGVSDDTYYRYDNSGHVILRADASGVSGYNDTYADLVNYGAGGSTYLNANSGLFTVYSYYTTTTATATSAGGVAGFEASEGISQGQLGTVVAQEAWNYFQQTVNGATDTPVATDTVYRNADGTGAQTTSYAYTWYSGTTQEQSVTTTLPVVTTAENGSGTANTNTTVYDTFGRVVWTKDESGYINYTVYDPLTGAVTETITDVNTLLTGEYTNLPTGWSTPTGGGLNLITTYQVDAFGRVTKETAPNGEVTTRFTMM